MGCGIAFVFAAAGRPVSVVEPSSERRNAFEERIAAIRTLLKVDKADLASIDISDRIADAVGNAKFVIEAGPENLEIKRQIFRELDELTPSDVI
ncbi:MAG: 3-hydroxyacyl-CoA dehydrogenase family protein, partial [Alphaproteobacteria bacterium]